MSVHVTHMPCCPSAELFPNTAAVVLCMCACLYGYAALQDNESRRTALAEALTVMEKRTANLQ